jgi:large subunit ribosomal protein L6
MSRIGKKPIPVPAGVTVTKDGARVTVNGPKGTLSAALSPRVKVAIEKDVVNVGRASDEAIDRSLHGLSRTVIANMVEGVTSGFSKKLEIHGVGYRGQMKGATLTLSLGFSHPVDVVPPAGITFGIEENVITVSGSDKALVGDTAARIRSFRKPEPYKGKGIRYAGEHVRRKEGKKAASA